MTAIVLFSSFAVLTLLNVPIGVGLAGAALLAIVQMEMSIDILPNIFFASTSTFVLLAIPFFILGGNIMEKAGISEKLIAFAQTFVGHIKGGLGIVCVTVACFFAAISGSGPATVAALGGVIIPAMVKVGYNPATAAALMATAGGIGVIIPPSISFVIYGSVTGISIGKLFMAGIIGVGVVLSILQALGIPALAIIINAFNWLLERQKLIGIGPKKPEQVRLTLTPGQLSAVTWLSLAGLPLVAIVAGVAVYFRRRR